MESMWTLWVKALLSGVFVSTLGVASVGSEPSVIALQVHRVCSGYIGSAQAPASWQDSDVQAPASHLGPAKKSSGLRSGTSCPSEATP